MCVLGRRGTWRWVVSRKRGEARPKSGAVGGGGGVKQQAPRQPAKTPPRNPYPTGENSLRGMRLVHRVVSALLNGQNGSGSEAYLTTRAAPLDRVLEADGMRQRCVTSLETLSFHEPTRGLELRPHSVPVRRSRNPTKPQPDAFVGLPKKRWLAPHRRQKPTRAHVVLR